MNLKTLKGILKGGFSGISNSSWSLRNRILYALNVDDALCLTDSQFKLVTGYTPEEYDEKCKVPKQTFEWYCESVLGLWDGKMLRIINLSSFTFHSEKKCTSLSDVGVTLDDALVEVNGYEIYGKDDEKAIANALRQIRSLSQNMSKDGK